MQFKLEIDCDNEAFSDDGLALELARCLSVVVKKLRAGDDEGKVRDINGNTVGHWAIVGEGSE